MRILLLTQWFEPEPALKGLAFARALRAQGHEVEVLTGFPNYPGGRLYPGYRVRLLQREVVDGVSIVRVPLYPSHDRSAVGRLANYVTFAIAAALLGPLFTKRADVVHAYQPPATVALPAMVLRCLKGTPFVYDVEDMWPDTLAASGMVSNRVVLGLVGIWCRLAYWTSSAVVAMSPGFVPLLRARGVSARKVTIIHNWCDETQLKPAAVNPALRRELGFEGLFNVVFAGNMGKGQALSAVLDAAALAASRAPRAQFVFIGGGIDADALERTAKARRLTNVVFLPRRPMSGIGEVLAQADVLLVHLRDEPLFRITTPSKIQAYLYVGRPVLCAVRGDAADLVLRAGAGVVCEPESAQSICDAVVKLCGMTQAELDEMGERGRQYYDKELSVAAGAAHFNSLFQRVARRRPSRTNEI